MEKLNWGIMGLGNIAQKFSEAITKSQNAKLLAVSSKNLEKLKNFKDRFNIEEKFLFNNYENLINCKDIDIIYIALPNSFHHYWAKQSILNKKNVLVEKPITLNFKEAQDIEKSLLNKDLFFGEAFMYRHHPQINLIIKMIKNNEIGNLKSMESSFGFNILTKKKFFLFNKKRKIDKNNRFFNKKLGGGCILDLGCYPTSFSLLIQSLIMKSNLEKIKILNVVKEINETGVEVDAKAEISFNETFKSKVKASFKNNLGNKSTIYGETGKLIIDNTWFGSNNIIKINKNSSNIIDLDNEKNIYSYQIENISKNIISNNFKSEFPAMSLQESLLNMKILDDWVKL